MAAMCARPVVAAFDVDGTLTLRDCVVPFLRRVVAPKHLERVLARQLPTLLPAAARRDRDQLKVLAALPVFSGRRVADVEEVALHFGDQVAARWLRDDTSARLAWHREHGHEVVLVSASFEIYLDVVGRHLGVAGVLGTRLASDDGVFTGALDGPNCRGEEKVRRLHQWLDERHGGRDAVELWAYGDSPGDRAMLADADHPVWTAGAIGSVARS